MKQHDLWSTEARHWHLSQAIGIISSHRHHHLPIEGCWYILKISCQFSKLLHLFQLDFLDDLLHLLHHHHYHLLLQFILLNRNGSFLIPHGSTTSRFKISFAPFSRCSHSQNQMKVRDLLYIRIWHKRIYCLFSSSGQTIPH